SGAPDRGALVVGGVAIRQIDRLIVAGELDHEERVGRARHQRQACTFSRDAAGAKYQIVAAAEVEPDEAGIEIGPDQIDALGRGCAAGRDLERRVMARDGQIADGRLVAVLEEHPNALALNIALDVWAARERRRRADDAVDDDPARRAREV